MGSLNALISFCISRLIIIAPLQEFPFLGIVIGVYPKVLNDAFDVTPKFTLNHHYSLGPAYVQTIIDFKSLFYLLPSTLIVLDNIINERCQVLEG